MDGYKKLSDKLFTIMVGRTSRLYFQEGKSAEEIASIIKEPLQRVEDWLFMIKVGRIKRLHFKEGKSAKEIAKVIGEPIHRVEDWIMWFEPARKLKQSSAE